MSGPHGYGQHSLQCVDSSSWREPGETQLPVTAPSYPPPFFRSYDASLDETNASCNWPLSTTHDQPCFQPNTQSPITDAADQYKRQHRSRHWDPEISRSPPQKRQKSDEHVATQDSIVENRLSESESQSECCSSCPSGPACDQADCPETVGEEVVVPCIQDPCDQPGRVDKRNKMCLSEGTRNPGAGWHIQSNPENKNANWEDASWNPQVVGKPFQMDNRYANGHAVDSPLMRGRGQDMYSQAEQYPETIPQSMAVDAHNSYSADAQPSSSFQTSAQPVFRSESETILHGTGGMFQRGHAGEWQDQSLNAPHNMNCHWGHCNEAFLDPSQMFNHLHGKHFDPYLKYSCPVPSSECKEIIEDPMEHLRYIHNWNQPYCPDSSCPEAGPEFCDPTWLHNHFDQEHSIQPQGGLYCRWDWCNSAMENFAHLSDHLSAQHALSFPGINEEDIDLDAPIAAGISPVCATDQRPALLRERVMTPKDNETHGLKCQWEMEGGICGVVKTGEDAAKELQDHVKREHLEQLSSKTGYICRWNNCNRVKMDINKQGFTQRGKLERHIASHTTYKCCECPECGLKFSAPQALKQHMNLHTDEKPWKCEHCDKRFPQQSAKTIHERTHTGEKPLKCEICGKKFSESSNLTKHRKTHGERGSHVCKIPGCGKAFHRFDQLNRHQKSHERKIALGKIVKHEDFDDETSTTLTSEPDEKSSVFS